MLSHTIYINFFKKYKNSIFVFILLAAMLIWVTPFHNGENASMMQAKELLSGKPYLPGKVSWIEMLAWEGHHYIAYPPMVTFLVMPYVFFNGQYLGDSPINSAMIFGSAIFMFLLVKRLEGIKQWASWAAIAYVIGTVNLHSAKVGSVWLLMHSFGNFFFLLALYLFCHRRAYFWSGLSFAIAFQVRYVILASILVFPLYALFCFNTKPTRWNWLYFVLGLIPPCALVWMYQWWVFGNPFISPYMVIFEQWGINHIFSIDHFQNNLKLYLFGMPTILSEFPYLHFDYLGQAMWIVSPFLLGLLVLNFKIRFAWAFLPSAIIMFVTYLFYYHSGVSQYGTRYVQDIFPLLIPMSFAGFSYSKLWIDKLLPLMIIISSGINVYAVFFTKFD